MESLILVVMMAALAFSVIGWLWITVAAFGDGEVIWGIGCILLAPVSIIYGFLNFGELKIPVLMLCVGMASRFGIGMLAVLLSA